MRTAQCRSLDPLPQGYIVAEGTAYSQSKESSIRIHETRTDAPIPTVAVNETNLGFAHLP